MHRGATFVAGVATFALVTCPLLRCSLQQASYDAPEEEDKETLQANSEDGEEGMVVRMVHVRTYSDMCIVFIMPNEMLNGLYLRRM